MPESISCTHHGNGVPLRTNERFYGVRDCVDAGYSSDHLWLRHGEFRIENRYTKRGFLVATGHLEVGLFVGDEGVALGLAAGPGSGGNANGGKHRPRRFAVALVVGHPAAICEDEINS